MRLANLNFVEKQPLYYEVAIIMLIYVLFFKSSEAVGGWGLGVWVIGWAMVGEGGGGIA